MTEPAYSVTTFAADHDEHVLVAEDEVQMHFGTPAAPEPVQAYEAEPAANLEPVQDASLAAVVAEPEAERAAPTLTLQQGPEAGGAMLPAGEIDASPSISAREFTVWSQTAAAGAETVYFTGNLARSRKTWTDQDGIEHEAVPGLDAIAKAASKAEERGDIRLLQRRVGPDRFEYVARRTTPPRPARLRGYSYGRTILHPKTRRAA